MSILIKGGRVIDPASGLDAIADVAVADGRVVGIQTIPADFRPSHILEASACVVAPGLIDLAARLRELGHEHARMLESEMAAAVAGGVTRLVCPPDTDPVLDEPGLVEMLRFRSEKLNLARLHPLGALTRKLAGDTLTDMVELSEAGCVAFSQAELPLANTLVMQRAFQYASTFDFAVWLRAQDFYLGRGVAASGALATRMGLSGVPVAAETIALHTIFELMRATGVRVHLCRLSSAAGVALVREAKREGLRLSCDVSINSLHLIDGDIGYFDSRARLNPPLRQQRDREALQAGLAEGTIDALVSDHTPVDEDAKALPFAESEAGATGLELLLSLSLKWGAQRGLSLAQSLAPICSGPAKVLGPSLGAQSEGVGRVQVGALADLCVFDPAAAWTVGADSLRSQGKHTPFSGYELPGRVRYTLVMQRAFQYASTFDFAVWLRAQDF
ncbi:MAG: dihydroorotase, partial [Burkholderiales bacterium]|nr:dihydroorotase [Burkholderiales bacterium]